MTNSNIKKLVHFQQERRKKDEKKDKRYFDGRPVSTNIYS